MAVSLDKIGGSHEDPQCGLHEATFEYGGTIIWQIAGGGSGDYSVNVRTYENGHLVCDQSCGTDLAE